MGDFDINSFLNDLAAKSGQAPVAPLPTLTVGDTPAIITAPAVMHDGPAINPPESTIVAVPPAVTAPASVPVAVEPEKPKRGRKPKATESPVESPLVTAAASIETSSRDLSGSLILASILSGLCANPALACMPAAELADRAIAIADEVTS